MEKNRNRGWVVVVALVVLALGNWLSAQEASEPPQIKLRVLDTSQQVIADVELLYFDGTIGKMLPPDEDGIFEIKPVPGLVIAKAEGYQFGGKTILANSIDGQQESPTADQHLTLTLRRFEEPGQIKTTLPFPLSQEQQEELRESLIERLMNSLANARDMMTQGRLLSILAQHQPERAMEFLSQNSNLPAPLVAGVKQKLVASLVKTNPEKALELIAEIDDPTFQSINFLALLQVLPHDSPLRVGVEEQWLRGIERIAQPPLKFASVASLIEHYFSTGQQEKGTCLLESHIDQVEQLPSAGWSVFPRSLFAALIVNQDADRAEAIVAAANPGSDSETREVVRAWARLAFHSCQNHEQTQYFLEKIETYETETKHFGYRFKVLQKLAVNHPQAAIELAGAIPDGNWKTWTLGIIANRIHPQRPDLARQALNEARQAALEIPANPEDQPTIYHPAVTLAGLLPVAEKVAPDQVESMLWEAAWLAIPRSRFSSGSMSNTANLQKVATSISRYDQQLGIALYRDREITASYARDGGASSAIILRPTTIDELIESQIGRNPMNSAVAIETLLNILSAEPNEVWDQISLPMGMQWSSDKFE